MVACGANDEEEDGNMEDIHQDNDLHGLQDYDYEEASMILKAQFDPLSRSIGKLSIEEEEIIQSHVCCPGLKYARIDTIKHWMTM